MLTVLSRCVVTTQVQSSMVHGSRLIQPQKGTKYTKIKFTDWNIK